MKKGFKHSEDTKDKMRKASLLRDNTKRIESLPRGEKHHNWAKEPSKLALHKRLHRKFGKAKNYICSKCPKQAVDWANISGKYTDKIEDYTPLCRSCHVKLDFTDERRKKITKALLKRHSNKNK